MLSHLTISQAARLLGVSSEAIADRIRRKTMTLHIFKFTPFGGGAPVIVKGIPFEQVTAALDKKQGRVPSK